MIEGQVCKANISPRGRRLRLRAGYVGATVSAALLGAGVALHWPWYVRALAAAPAALSAFGFFQARRNTCVARADEGMFEHDDFSKTKADEADVAASRKVAKGIRRDVALVAGTVAVLAIGSALIG